MTLPHVASSVAATDATNLAGGNTFSSGHSAEGLGKKLFVESLLDEGENGSQMRCAAAR